MHGALVFFEVTPTVSWIPVRQHKMLVWKAKKKKQNWLDTELLHGRALSLEICLWICQWGMQEGM